MLAAASQKAVNIRLYARHASLSLLCVLLGGLAAARLQAQSPASVRPRKILADLAEIDSPLPDAPGTCHLRGVIRGSGGAPVAGAHLTLASVDQTVRTTDSRADGGYGWDGLQVGTYTITVATPGFLPARYKTVLPEEGGIAEVSIGLQIVPVSDSVSVVATEAEVAEAELKLETTQRFAGVFPNFFVSYQWRAAPLSSRQKFGLAFKNARDPGNLLLVGVVAGVQQATNSFPGYGQGAKGYGRRYGADLGNLVAGTFLGGAVLPSLFHQDPRYFYRGTGTTRSRFWYAATRAVVTRGDNGRPQPNWSGMLGDLSAGAVSNLYYAPEDRQGARLTIENGLLGIAGDAMNGVFQEFFLKRLTTNTKGRSGKATVSTPELTGP